MYSGLLPVVRESSQLPVEVQYVSMASGEKFTSKWPLYWNRQLLKSQKPELLEPDGWPRWQSGILVSTIKHNRYYILDLIPSTWNHCNNNSFEEVFRYQYSVLCTLLRLFNSFLLVCTKLSSFIMGHFDIKQDHVTKCSLFFTCVSFTSFVNFSFAGDTRESFKSGRNTVLQKRQTSI